MCMPVRYHYAKLPLVLQSMVTEKYILEIVHQLINGRKENDNKVGGPLGAVAPWVST